MRARKLPTLLRRQVFDYYEYRWSQHKYFNERAILDELSPGLKVVGYICDTHLVSGFSNAVEQEIIKQNCQPLVQALPFLRNAHPDLIEAITTQVSL
jgi:hypothetical protein